MFYVFLTYTLLSITKLSYDENSRIYCCVFLFCLPAIIDILLKETIDKVLG